MEKRQNIEFSKPKQDTAPQVSAPRQKAPISHLFSGLNEESKNNYNYFRLYMQIQIRYIYLVSLRTGIDEVSIAEQYGLHFRNLFFDKHNLTF